ncbi:MAG: hypothetical protein JWO80_1424 [Bryobacterales bacterium]|nr:hypothetical protein [Bryobacterales bacterium]
MYDRCNKGAVMPAAKVTDAARSVRETSTNDPGYYVVQVLRPSTNILTVEATAREDAS